MKKKVLILMDMPLFPYRIYAYNMLAERGYDLTVMSVGSQNKTYDIPLNFSHYNNTIRRIGPFFKIDGFNLPKTSDYDAIIVAPNLRFLDFYRLYNRKFWNKLIGWGHHKGCTSGNKVASWARTHFFEKFPALIFYDYQTQTEYLKKGFNPNNLYVANNTQYVNPETVDLEEPRDSFIYVGRIQERKRIDMAIKAFAKLKANKSSSGIKFKIIGGGDRSKLQELVSEYGINESVLFIDGTHDEKELANVFNSAIAYVSPGHVGLGVLHSLAFGVPTITCYDRKHSVEISNCREDNSFVVKFDVDAIYDAMLKLSSDDDTLRKKMSRAAHKYYNTYCTLDKMVDGIDSAICHILH